MIHSATWTKGPKASSYSLLNFTQVPTSVLRIVAAWEDDEDDYVDDDKDGSDATDPLDSSRGLGRRRRQQQRRQRRPLAGLADEIERAFGVTPHHDTKAFVLEPGRRARVRMRFQPDSVMSKFHQGVIVRNNLTGVELALVSGESVVGEFKFGKFKHTVGPRESVLEFDMKEKHLRDCDSEFPNIF